MQPADVKKIQQSVLFWYQTNGRHDLPWRQFDLPANQLAYRVLVSEFMLQQTQVDRVIPKFELFFKAFPTVKDLAAAPTSNVIQLWSGLGYNRRAIHLHKTAQAVMKDCGGMIPQEVEALKKLPGIGSYTAGAVASFAFNQPVVVLDTNIQRFYELLFWGYSLPPKEEIESTAKRFIPRNQSRLWHSALMDRMSRVGKIASAKEQQTTLLQSLRLEPDWPLPELSDNRLVRPKQSTFRASRRFYRGQIITHLGRQPGHTTALNVLDRLMLQVELPDKYRLADILTELKKDGLIWFEEPLSEASAIRLPSH